MFALINPLACVRINKGFHVGRAGLQVLVGVKTVRLVETQQTVGPSFPLVPRLVENPFLLMSTLYPVSNARGTDRAILQPSK